LLSSSISISWWRCANGYIAFIYVHLDDSVRVKSRIQHVPLYVEVVEQYDKLEKSQDEYIYSFEQCRSIEFLYLIKYIPQKENVLIQNNDGNQPYFKENNDDLNIFRFLIELDHIFLQLQYADLREHHEIIFLLLSFSQQDGIIENIKDIFLLK